MDHTTKPIVYIENVQRYHTVRDCMPIARTLLAGTVVFIVLHGTGTLKLGGRRYSLHRGQVYVIFPEMEALFLEEGTDGGASGCFIDLRVYEPSTDDRENSREFRRMPWPFAVSGKLDGVSEADWLMLAERLPNAAAADGIRAFAQAETMRSKLLLLLLECSESGRPNRDHAISRTIAYMERNYHTPIDRHKLAGLAGMSVWHYSDLFKKQTGQGPIAYLNAIRIQYAKKALLSTSMSVAQIAGQAGFADEYYFSRKFKHHEGLSPSAYRRLERRKIAAVNFPFTGQLLALRVIPYVAVVDQARDSHRSSYFNLIPFQLQRSEHMSDDIWSYNANMLREARPELIMCSEEEAQSYRTLFGASSELVVIPWMELDWRQQLCRIADLLGKRKEAEEWLKDYDRKAKTAAQAIRSHIGEAAVSIVHVKNGRLYIYGKRNCGSVLYGDLGLRPAYPYRRIAVSHSLSPSELRQYAGDHMLVVINKDEHSRAQWNSWRQSGIWSDLIPFRQRQVYEVDEMPWLDYSAHGHALILDEAVKLFASPPYVHA